MGLLFSYGALAESSPAAYKYGDKLDISKVLSITVKHGSVCKPVGHVMKYLDSTGEIRTIKYRALSGACNKRR
ncbi:DUF2790 domain-containing protein [Stutzerimonas stutzeri]|uniref:DUF2790 domain-containing protein n=1 Tax=Stutzerimonas stutzeri TaxID=316 RepID=UPI0009BA6207|nr:DUF2790 domain-containing protein [Stutzerimonas stutzeri]TFZ22822.1 DUF2790 domain-containing protein [Stutzerimonas stutzeri]HAG19352.1 DUF2790 domain-containing protein [Pseudomonas sp.]